MENNLLFGEETQTKDRKTLWNESIIQVCNFAKDYDYKTVLEKKEKLNRVKTWTTKTCIYKEYSFLINDFECILQYWKPLTENTPEKAQYSLWDNRDNRYFRKIISS